MGRQIQFVILTIVLQVINSQDQQQISIGKHNVEIIVVIHIVVSVK